MPYSPAMSPTRYPAFRLISEEIIKTLSLNNGFLPNFEYDIFISYRHNDNKYDGWVTEFVNNLNKEIEATLKDKVNVYFDANMTK